MTTGQPDDPTKNPHAVAMSLLGASKGGKARKEALTPERRSEIARTAAQTKHGTNAEIPKALHIGELKIGDMVLSAAVLPDGVRVLSQGGVAAAFGPVTGGWQARKKAADEHSGELPPFLVAASLKDYISDDLRTLVAR